MMIREDVDKFPFDWCFQWYWERDYKVVSFFFGRFVWCEWMGGYHFQVRSFRVRPVIWYSADTVMQYFEALASMSRNLDI